MAEPRKRSSRRQTIEPLNYAEAALAPALKGMTSFLDLSPEDVRRGNFAGLVVRKAEDASPAVDESSPGDVKVSLTETFEVQSSLSSEKPYEYVTSPADDMTSSRLGTTDAHASPPAAENVSTPGAALDSGTIKRLDASSLGATVVGTRRADRVPQRAFYANDSDYVSVPVERKMPDADNYSAYVSSPAPARPLSWNMGDASPTLSSLIPGRGRSGVRRCLLAQDGHSLGEEAIYQLLWRNGDAEAADPNSSRTVQMGAAEIGLKINMAKKNVRQNIARLFEKLAIEIVEDFATMTSQARLYRVFSSKQILQRRRAAGMEYVLRNKGVVFCERNGDTTKASPAYETSPGHESVLRPARPKRKQKRVKIAALPAYRQISEVGEAPSGPQTDVEVVLEAFGHYAAVNMAVAMQMAEQVIEDCRRIRANARADEIAFLIQEKLSLTRGARSMPNAIGLALAAVPQAFADASLEEFRHRLARRADFAAEEADWARRDRAEFKAWMTRERDALIDLASDASVPEETRSKAEWELRQRDWSV